MDYPLVNGHRMSFSSIEVSIDGKAYWGFTAVNYTDTLEGGLVRGVHPQPLGRTRGEYSCEASLTSLLEESRDFVKALGDGFMEKVFDVVVVYSEDGNGTHQDEIQGCRVQSIAHAHASGTDGLTVDITLMPLRIIRDGLAPMQNMLQGAGMAS